MHVQTYTCRGHERTIREARQEERVARRCEARGAMSIPCEQVCDLQRQRCSMAVFAADEVSHLVVDANAETGIDVVLLAEPLHGHQHQV